MKPSPYFGATYTEENLARIKQRRREHIRLREEMAQYQKECVSRQDRSGARFFSAEAKEAMKMERATTICVQWIEGDILIKNISDELMDKVVHEFQLAFDLEAAR